MEPQSKEAAPNSFAELAAIDCSKFIEKKGKEGQRQFSYIPWVWALDQLMRRDAEARWEYRETNGIPYVPMPDGTAMVVCTVHAFGRSRTMQLPVMNGANKAVQNPDAFDVNTAMQRCLVKAIALHGIGLSVYAGEDMPRDEDGNKQEADPQFTKAERDELVELYTSAAQGSKALKAAWQKLEEKKRDRFRSELAGMKTIAEKNDAEKAKPEPKAAA